MSLAAIIKRAAKEQAESSQPVAVLYGTVTRSDPLEVNVEQRFALTADFLVVPEHIGAALMPGDRLALLRATGGRQFIVLGRLTT